MMDAQGTKTDGRRITNAMTVDVEEHFQVAALAEKIRREDWDSYPSRIERNTDKVLQMFADHEVRATFFTLGWVARRHPEMIRRIVDAGHELASHGFAHFRVSEQAPEIFREDVRTAKRILEDLGGKCVLGYRAASFSINHENQWAFDILAEEEYAYSSSVYPIRHDHYGIPDAPRFPYRPRGQLGVLEIPISTVALFDRNFPCGGGGYFRLLPYGLSARALRHVNRHEGQPCVFYFHPWEIDPDQPRQTGLSFKSRIRHYTNLSLMEGRLHAVLSQFRWNRIDAVFLSPAPVPMAQKT